MSDRQVKKEIFEGLKQPQQKDLAKLILANQNKTLNLSLVICVLQNAPLSSRSESRQLDCF